jgi:hypothetical protein
LLIRFNVGKAFASLKRERRGFLPKAICDEPRLQIIFAVNETLRPLRNHIVDRKHDILRIEAAEFSLRTLCFARDK